MADLDILRAKRRPIKSALTRFKNVFTDHDKTSGVGSLPARLQTYEQLYEKFDTIQTQIEMLVENDQEISRIQAKERDDFETIYFNVLTEAREFIARHRPGPDTQSQLNPSTSASSTPVNVESTQSAESFGVKLPTITLPNFDGSFKDWLIFRDTFKSLIHDNARLTNIQKFHYLNSALTGDAARVIVSLGVSDANYLIAWKALTDRYEDSLSMVHFHTKCLFEVSAISKTSYIALRQLIDDTNNHLLALKALGERTEYWDTLITYLITTKLDQFTKREWEKRSALLSVKPSLKDFTTFLESQVKYLQRTAIEKPDTSNQNNNKRGTGFKVNNVKSNERLSSHATTKKACPLCTENHPLYKCERLLKLPIQSRIQEVSRLGVCFNCLSPGHHNKQCTFGSCRKCTGKHNTLLHRERESDSQVNSKCEENNATSSIQSPPINSQPADKPDTNLPKRVLVINSANKEHILFGTAIVLVKDRTGRKHECRAILDSCSQVNLMTRHFSKKLKLPLSNSDVVISGVGKTTCELQQCVSVTVESRCTGFKADITCLVTSAITDDMPNVSIQRNDFNIPSGITLADPDFANTRPVDLLISAGLFWTLLCVGQIQLRDDQPIIQKTKLGWIIAGPMYMPSMKSSVKRVCNLITNQQLHEEVTRFWQIEHVSTKPEFPILDTRDHCEQHFRTSTVRNSQGKFVVSIPLKDNHSKLGQSLTMATRRLESMERKFINQPVLKEKYVDFMKDYEDQGHMIELQPEELQLNGPVCYLPHHAVFKESSTTTKLRVVFDGSAKTSSGISFNEVQRVGPIVQNDLFSIVLRFRQHKIVLSADIAQMYRQIEIVRNQQDLQRIVWRADSSEPMKHYRLTTVTYGTASAPFLATRSLREIGEENRVLFPITSNVIMRDFYVDDLLTGTETLEEARLRESELNQLLEPSGFHLRKWASNIPQIFGDQQDITMERTITGEKDPKTLGLIWNSHLDQLKYSIEEAHTTKVTKRTMLSKIAKIFDPLGLVGPVIVRAKVLLQKLWQLQIDWDESLPQDIHTAWTNFSLQLTSLNNVRIDRRVLCNNPTVIQLHGFSDASESAYGACVYLKSLDKHQNSSIHLLCAKSRVAPLKNISLPRLELQAALLLAQLVDSVNTALNVKINETFLWTDSTITLYWIQSPPSRWKTYIASRTSEIQTITNATWLHVRSQDNPADLISRGIDPELLSNCELWWKGPEWLSQGPPSWPIQELPNVTNPPEQRRCERTLLVSAKLDFSILQRYSTLMRLIRVAAYCLRFSENLRRTKMLRKYGSLEVQELESARVRLLKLAQSQEFTSELNTLKETKQVSSKSKLLTLNPFIDAQGLIRVGGRLINAPVPFDQKHPIILAPNNPLTKLIIKHEHLRLLHAGCQTTITSIRTQYWPLACKNAVKNVLHRCVKCFRAKPVGLNYIMANLPSSRVTPGKPFSVTGVDYAGPFYMIEKLRSRTVIKSYLCVFVCFVTKAVHLELARDLSTDAFLHCLQRFIARRGVCKQINSDNGTNFVGARNELNELFLLLTNDKFQNDVHDFLANQKIEWHMIPPSAPHFGGLWEGAVKSAKKHLYRVVGDTRLTYEELYTLLTQVESCLNSRPLTPQSNDPNDLTPLTPGHFLTGDSLTAVPQPSLLELPKNRLSRYQHLQQMLQHFWQRWQREYLTHLQERHKWSQSIDNRLVPGTVVIIRDDDLPPLKWQLGRIIELHPGQDKVTRVVSVKMGKSVLKRPVSKICILPID